MQVAREKLVALEIPFVQHTTVRGSPKRQLLVDKYGKFAVPYLEVSSACVRLHLPYRVAGLFCAATMHVVCGTLDKAVLRALSGAKQCYLL